MVATSTIPQQFGHLIHDQWITGDRCFDNRNPADTDDVLSRFPRGTAQDVDRAVEAARRAFPAWSQTPPPVRARVLFCAAELLTQRKDELATVIVKEMGKTMAESRGDIQSAIDMAQFVAGEGRRWYGETTSSELANRWALTKRVPVGVCGIITAWNAPMATPAWKIFPALQCGNTVVFKPAEDTPETAHHLGKLLLDAGLPPGVLNIVHGLGEEAGAAIVRHPGIDLLSFTGSSEVGRLIAEEGAKRLARVSLELGGKNASILLPDAALPLAVKGIVAGAFSVAGQRCASTSRVIVHEAIYDDFLKQLLDATRALVLGAGMNPKTQVCPMINQAQIERTERYVALGQKEGAHLLLGGKRATVPDSPRGLFFEPTIFTQVKPSMTIAREEIFGPVLCVFKVASFEEAIAVHNDVPYGLTASIFTADANLALKALDQMKAGVCYVNAPTFGSEVHMPFGGFDQSGNGHREAGMGGIDVFSELKTIYIDYSAQIQNAQYVDPQKRR